MPTIVRTSFFFGDLLFLNLALYVSNGSNTNWLASPNQIYLIIYSNFAWLFLIAVSNPYNVTKGWTLSKTAKSQLAFLFIHLLVVASLVLFFKKSYSFFEIASIYLIFIPIFFFWKVIVIYIKKISSKDIKNRQFIIVGKSQLSEEIRKYFLLNREEGYRFQAYVDFKKNNSFLDDIRKICEENEVHTIFCCAPKMNEDNLKQLIDFGLDSFINVKIVFNGPAVVNSIQLQEFDQSRIVNVPLVALDDQRNQFLKNSFDFIFSGLFTFLILSWLIPIIAVLIKLDSRGPVFFVQLRSGKGNQSFKCLKFRSMVVNNESDFKQASSGDNRITRFGRFLRKSSIDELPQFINVLMGSMSVIGPRPHMLSHTEKYSALIEKFMGRHYVKPGITGLAQCMGYRGETKNLADMENRVRLDRYYIENWTFWLDIKIIFLTVVSLLRGSEKAY